jgi:glycosyltransferase involved in cell wall biosynthesis
MALWVSVVIPCYNQAHFLAEAITSALDQAYRPREVVVVDDGATDDTAAVAARYPDVQCLRQRNQGLAAARNAGLRACRGDLVVFLDADDRLLPGALAVGAAAAEAHPDAVFVVGRHRRIDADGAPLPTPMRPRVMRDHYASLVRRCWIAMPATVMYRAATLRAVGGFDARQRYAEDYDLYLKLARRFPVVDHHVEVAEYRQHPGTISRDVDRMLRATLGVLAAHRPGPSAPAALRRAWHARDNVVWYFDRLLDAALDDLAHGRWPVATRRLLVFARYLPQHPDYARRRLTTPLRWAWRALRRPAVA